MKQDSPQTKATPHKSWFHRVFQLLVDTGTAFSNDDCFTMAAALSYFAVLSALPLLLLLVVAATALATLIAPDFDITAALLNFVQQFFSPEIEAWVRETLPTLAQQTALLSSGNLLLLIWSGANIFGQLDLSFNRIWGTYDSNDGETGASINVRSMAKWYMRGTLRSLLLLVGAFGLFVLDQLLCFALFLLRERLSNLPIVEQLRLTFDTPLVDATAFFLNFLSLALLYRYLPPIRAPWRAVFPGALLGAVAIIVANTVLGTMFSGLFAGIYKALGGPIALMLWVNLVGQGILLGCELTRHYWLLLNGGAQASPAMPTALA